MEIFVKYCETVLGAEVSKRKEGRLLLREDAEEFLGTAMGKKRISKNIREILEINIATRPSWNMADAARVFGFMENFAINIHDSPWKVELQKITVSSFHKTASCLKIDEHVGSSEPVSLKIF